MVAGRLPLVYHDPLDSYRKAELQNGQAGPDALRSIGCVKQYHDTIKLTKRSSPLSRKKMAQKGELLFVKIRLKIPSSPVSLSPLIEQKLHFVQLVFPPPDALPGYYWQYLKRFVSSSG